MQPKHLVKIMAADLSASPEDREIRFFICSVHRYNISIFVPTCSKCYYIISAF